MRLDQYLSDHNIASRREAKRLVEQGLVLVNAVVIREPGYKLRPTDKVTVPKTNTKALEKTTILIYKPRGITCSHNSNEGKTLFQLFPQFSHLTYVGRLDKDSEGLLLLSNDGRMTKLITGTDLVEKEYVITVREEVKLSHLDIIKKGMKIEREYVEPAQAFRVSKNELRIILREGKKHQVRRMANALHLTVTSLVRTRIGSLGIGKLRPGYFRKLLPAEEAALLQLLDRQK